MVEPKRQVEAILFISSEGVELQALAKACGIAAIGYVKGLIEELVKEYESRGSALTIIEESPGKYIMTVKKEYLEVIKDFAKESYFTREELRVLAYLSHNGQVLKSELAKLLGSQIYLAVRSLCEKGFVEQKKKGRTSLLVLTKKYETYFTQNKG